MSRSKTAKFDYNKTAPNVIEPEKELYDKIKGNWNSVFFKNDNPIILEVGCGKGEYTVGMAEKFPNKNFIGSDIKGDRICVGSRNAIEKELHNVGFMRTQIQQIENFFTPNEVDEIWITFPDPRPKDRDIKRRLSGPSFMEIYESILKPNGIVHFKTDSLPLFEYTLEEVLPNLDVKNLVSTKDLYESDLLDDIRGIKTHYEKLFSAKGFKINYLRFNF